mmetsp:Transcript_31645/g.63999  ORF Transcript_31645/g.63999 Transcript_31645/m.63999 type:complete len:81 (+) Transcript_31645:3-245(+)
MTKSGKRPVRLLSNTARALQPFESGKIHPSNPFWECYKKWSLYGLDSLDSREEYDVVFDMRRRGSGGAQQAQGPAAVDGN